VSAKGGRDSGRSRIQFEAPQPHTITRERNTDGSRRARERRDVDKRGSGQLAISDGLAHERRPVELVVYLSTADETWSSGWNKGIFTGPPVGSSLRSCSGKGLGNNRATTGQQPKTTKAKNSTIEYYQLNRGS